jgi:voltage-gated potassium channel Kch
MLMTTPTPTRRRHTVSRIALLTRAWLRVAVFGLAVITLVTGAAGFFRQTAESTPTPAALKPAEPREPLIEESAPPEKDWSIPFFRTMQIFLLNAGSEDDAEHPSNAWLVAARLSAALLFLSVSFAVIGRVLNEARAFLRLLFLKRHVVICGLGQIGLQLLDDLYQQRRTKKLIIVELDPEHPWLDHARTLGALVILGDATKTHVLEEARVLHAAEVFLVSGDDGTNLECAAEIDELLRTQPRGLAEPLKLHVHIADPQHAATMRSLSERLQRSQRVVLQVFNATRNAALKLVTTIMRPRHVLRGDEVAHFVILGFGAMGQELALQLALLGHFANRRRNRFTIADHDIRTTARGFLARYGRFTSWQDPEPLGVTEFPAVADEWSFNAHPLPPTIRVPEPEAVQYVANAEFVDLPSGRTDEGFIVRLAQQVRAQPRVQPALFICGRHDRDNFDEAAQVRQLLINHGLEHVPIYVWLPRQPALAAVLAGGAQLHVPQAITPFGECRDSANHGEITAPFREVLGRLVQENYEAARQADKPEYVITPWSRLSENFRESNRAAADHFLIKLSQLGLQLEPPRPGLPPTDIRLEPDDPRLTILAEIEHNRWMADRLLDGWRYGPTLDRARRVHHELVTCETLSQRNQDDRERALKKDREQIVSLVRRCQMAGFRLTWIPGRP